MVAKTARDNGLTLGAIAAEQFSRKGRSAIDDTLSKRLFIDHQQSTLECFALTSSDLGGCYDRIIHTAVTLALRRIGVPKSRIESMFGVIQQMTHRIRTAYGDSDITYGGDNIGDWDNFSQGILQGNTTWPDVWSALSSVVFEVLHKRGFGCKMITSISRQLFTLVGFAYVDDCDLMQTGSDPLLVLTSMQKLINSWGDLMEVTGGALRTDKSWYYLIEYVWKHGKWTASDPDIPIDLMATDMSGQRIALSHLRCNEAAEMLGVWMAPNGDRTKLISELRAKAVEWGGKITRGNTSRNEAWTALNSNISASLKYPLPACTLTKKECKSIMWPAIKAALPRSGIASVIAGKIRDGPGGSGGSGSLSLYHYMGTSRTSKLVEELFRGTPLGFGMKMCIEDLVLDAGWYGLLWKMPFMKISKYIAAHSWLYSVIAYNHKYDISINAAHQVLKEQRVNDAAIMTMACSNFENVSDLRSINRVRQGHQCNSLSEMCTADGLGVDKRYMTSKISDARRNNLGWPTQSHITKKDNRVWKKFITSLCKENETALLVPFGGGGYTVLIGNG